MKTFRDFDCILNDYWHFISDASEWKWRKSSHNEDEEEKKKKTQWNGINNINRNPECMNCAHGAAAAEVGKCWCVLNRKRLVHGAANANCILNWQEQVFTNKVFGIPLWSTLCPCRLHKYFFYRIESACLSVSRFRFIFSWVLFSFIGRLDWLVNRASLCMFLSSFASRMRCIQVKMSFAFHTRIRIQILTLLLINNNLLNWIIYRTQIFQSNSAQNRIQ